MKMKLCLGLMLTLWSGLHAEVFLGPTSATNRLTIPTNAAIIISCLLADSISSQISASIVLGATSHQAGLRANTGNPNLALAGPAEIILGSRVGLCYKVVQGNAIRSIAVVPEVTLDIPEGKTARFFAPISEYPAFVTITKGGVSVNGDIRGGEEFTGPVTLLFRDGSAGAAISIYSYYFTEDFLVMPDLGWLQGPTGSFEIVIEKSTDLNQWFPVAAHNTSNDQRAFYRFKLTR